MTTTVKRISLSLTKEQQRQLEALCDYLGENQSQVIHRAIGSFYIREYTYRLQPIDTSQDGNAK